MARTIRWDNINLDSSVPSGLNQRANVGQTLLAATAMGQKAHQTNQESDFNQMMRTAAVQTQGITDPIEREMAFKRVMANAPAHTPMLEAQKAMIADTSLLDQTLNSASLRDLQTDQGELMDARGSVLQSQESRAQGELQRRLAKEKAQAQANQRIYDQLHQYEGIGSDPAAFADLMASDQWQEWMGQSGITADQLAANPYYKTAMQAANTMFETNQSAYALGLEDEDSFMAGDFSKYTVDENGKFTRKLKHVDYPEVSMDNDKLIGFLNTQLEPFGQSIDELDEDEKQAIAGVAQFSTDANTWAQIIINNMKPGDEFDAKTFARQAGEFYNNSRIAARNARRNRNKQPTEGDTEAGGTGGGSSTSSTGTNQEIISSLTQDSSLDELNNAANVLNDQVQQKINSVIGQIGLSNDAADADKNRRIWNRIIEEGAIEQRELMSDTRLGIQGRGMRNLPRPPNQGQVLQERVGKLRERAQRHAEAGNVDSFKETMSDLNQAVEAVMAMLNRNKKQSADNMKGISDALNEI